MDFDTATPDKREARALARWRPGVRWYHPAMAKVVIATSKFITNRMNKLEIDGAHRFDGLRERDGRGLLTISNHVSIFDDPILVSSLVTGPYSSARWIGADALNFFGSRFKAWLFTAGKSVPIVRGAGIDQPGMHFLADRLGKGDWVHLFPEGGRTRDPDARMAESFRAGIGWLIAGARPIVLPFYHYGMQKVLPVGAVRPRGGNRIDVLFGDAVDCNEQWISDTVSARAGKEVTDSMTWDAITADMRERLALLERRLHPAFRPQAYVSIIACAAIGLGVILAYVTLVWLASLALRNASIIDIFWGPGFAVATLTYVLLSDDGWSGRQWLVLGLVSVWGLRLGAYIAWRNTGHGEDYRYQKMRENAGSAFWWRSLATVFWLQGLLLWVISAPLLAAVHSDSPDHFVATDFIGIALWAVGFLFESVGDIQLALFKSKPENKGKVMDRGLWRYTRHPNYFGDATLWWGYFAIAAGTDWGWVTFFGPAIMTILLTRVSGAALLERTIHKRRPEYEDYVRRTSGFIPLPPKRA